MFETLICLLVIMCVIVLALVFMLWEAYTEINRLKEITYEREAWEKQQFYNTWY